MAGVRPARTGWPLAYRSQAGAAGRARDAATLRVARAAGRRRGARISAAQAFRPASRALLASKHRAGLPAAPRSRAAQVDRPAGPAAWHPSAPTVPADGTRRAGAPPLARAAPELAAADPRRD